MAHVGAEVREGEAILRVHHRGGRGLGEALPLLADAVANADEAPMRRTTVIERVSPAELEN